MGASQSEGDRTALPGARAPVAVRRGFGSLPRGRAERGPEGCPDPAPAASIPNWRGRPGNVTPGGADFLEIGSNGAAPDLESGRTLGGAPPPFRKGTVFDWRVEPAGR